MGDLTQALALLRESGDLDNVLSSATHPEAWRVLVAHAERTLAARSGEPEGVRVVRWIADRRADGYGGIYQITRREACEVVEALDHLTARLAEVERERDALIEDRARFPDRPDHIGRLIQWHIDDLKSRATQANDLARELRTDRDTLAGIVERVKALPTWDHDPTGDTLLHTTMGRMDEAGCVLAENGAGDWVKTADILAALTPTREG